jgi:hypothetical protein
MACKQNERWDSVKQRCFPKFGGTTGNPTTGKNNPPVKTIPTVPVTTNNPGEGKPPVIPPKPPVSKNKKPIKIVKKGGIVKTKKKR